MRNLLLSANKHFPLVTIHLEEVDPDVCYIGKVSGVDKEFVKLMCITPDGEWEEEESFYYLKDITRIDFGGAYEDALDLVATKTD